VLISNRIESRRPAVGSGWQARAISTVTTRRWTKDGTAWFAVGGLGPELAGPAERLLMDCERHGEEWWHGYPAGTPQLDRCWENFSAWAPAMLRQAARLDPVRGAKPYANCAIAPPAGWAGG
jgi:hypothetical protein